MRRLPFIHFGDRMDDWREGLFLFDRGYPFLNCRLMGGLHLIEFRSIICHLPPPQLAGELRRPGGFAKDTTPFSEFLWADFLRRRVKRDTVEADFKHALEKALELAKDEQASYLPGWCGPVFEE